MLADRTMTFKVETDAAVEVTGEVNRVRYLCSRQLLARVMGATHA